MTRKALAWLVPGMTRGRCPACQLWVPLTDGGYVSMHHYVVVDGRVQHLPSGHTGPAVRCRGVGRDPLRHRCTPPSLAKFTNLVLSQRTRWQCDCGLSYQLRYRGAVWRWEPAT